MSNVTFSEGSELAGGRYVLERRLGSGGMATVWLAQDTRLARKVAVKLPSEALSADETFARRFEREAQTAAALSHQNLVSVYDYGTEGERPYLVSEYVDGSNLAELRKGERAPATEELARALLDALADIHAAGIVHRDIKPANVLVDEGGRILLTDFGIAQSTEETRLTGTGKVIGTLSYIAPEVKHGDRAGPAADLYALGVVLSEQLSEEDPDRVARLVGMLKQLDPEARPSDAGEALGMLERDRVFLSETQTMETAPAEAGEPATTDSTEAAEPVTERAPAERVAPAAASEPPRPRPFSLPPEQRSRPSASGPAERGSRRLPLALGLGAGALIVTAVVAVLLLSGGGNGGGGDGGNGGGGDKRGGGAAGQGTQASTDVSTTTTPTETTTTAPTTTTDVPTGGSDPERGAALNDQGFALLQQGDVAGALPKLKRSVAAFPADSTDMTYAFALFNYARALRLSGDPAAAIPLLEKRLSFSDFKVDVVQAELDTARQAAGVGDSGG